jgi:hypothetical protein
MINLEIMARARRLLDAVVRSAKQRTVKSRRVTISTHLNRSNDTVHLNSQPVWMETEARIVACNYAPARRKLWSLRSTTSCKTSIISFTYYAHARTYYGIFISHQAMSAGRHLPCLLQRSKSAREHSLAANVWEQKRAVGGRHTWLRDPDDPSPCVVVGLAATAESLEMLQQHFVD